MADTIDVDGNGDPITDRSTQLQQTSSDRALNAKKTPIRDFLRMCKNAFDRFANVVDFTYTTIRNATIKATIATAILTFIAVSQSPDAKQELISAFENIGSEQTTPPTPRP